jgi:hypothetical protein
MRRSFLLMTMLLITLGVFALGDSVTTQTCLQSPSGLASWWPGDGNANDLCGGNNGALMGGATFH